MPVDSTHSAYDEALPKWERIRAVIGGSDSVKEAGEKYLPKLTDQSTDEYEAYKMRAHFFNATARTRDGFSGMIFRKPPTIEAEPLKAFLEDCDLGGQSFNAYAKHVTDEVIGPGRIGTLIEFNASENRPYICAYLAEQVINWRYERINGRNVLALLVLKESVTKASAIGATYSANPSAVTEQKSANTLFKSGDGTGPGPQPSQIAGKSGEDDPFQPAIVEQLRVYKLTPAPGGETEIEKRGEEEVPIMRLAVICEVWRKDAEKGKQWELYETLTPIRKGKPLPEIPFVFHGPRDSSAEIERPPLEDIAETNLSHYRSSADLEHGRHFTGLPTAWVAGFPKDSIMKIGSATAWVSTDPNAKAAYLEFEGQGLGALKEALEQKENHMAVLGARMLEQSKRAVETAEAMQIRAAGEGSVLSNIASSLSQSFTLVLKWALWWQGTADKRLSDIGDEAIVTLNTDFQALKLDAPTIVALVKSWQVGALSHDSLVYVLKQGEHISPDRTVEEEIDLIHTETMPERSLPPEPTTAPAKKAKAKKAK